MSLKLYNTQSGTKETFVPIDPERITFYVCGPTVYNFIHIGNARPPVIFDTLCRLLKFSYPNVIYARNITDIDDKINAAAKANNESIRELSDRFADAYRQDIAQLYVEAPTIEPRATDHMVEMIEMIQTLVDKQHAYEAEGHVMFDVESMPSYGYLSHRKLDDMIAGARVDVADYKKHPADFVLWKPSDDETPGWDSPWGRGRPGWHIECSAMIAKHLGQQIDIHGGGQDLIFPHHENEHAQSCCAHGTDNFVNYWIHNGYITVDGKKMSKSEGNFTTLRDVLKKASGEVTRLALLGTHYRSPLDWTDQALSQSQAILDSLYQALRVVKSIDASTNAPVERVIAALNDDLNTPGAITVLQELATTLNKTTKASEQATLKGQLIASGALLGVLQQDPDQWFQGDDVNDDQSKRIDDLIVARNEARANRDFAQADAIRDQLDAMGVVLEDGSNGTQWRLK